jgi:hypothetical protein
MKNLLLCVNAWLPIPPSIKATFKGGNTKLEERLHSFLQKS